MALIDQKMEESEKKSALSELFSAGVHIGYGKARRHPKMQEYIYGLRNNIEIIDLESSEKKIGEAESFLKSLGKEGKVVLFVGTKPNAKEYIKKTSESLNMPCVTERWLGGTLTNFKVISGRIAYLERLETEEKSGGFEKYTKKEHMLKKFEIEKLRRMFNGIRNLKAMPGALVVVDPKEEKTAVLESLKKNIPIVALMNVDCDPDGISYPIPMNDNSSQAIALVLSRLEKAYSQGFKEKQEVVK